MSSYCVRGGFNVRPGGQLSDRILAKSIPKDQWTIAMGRLAEQGVYEAQANDSRISMERDMKYAGFPDQLSEKRDAVEKKEVELKGLEDKLARERNTFVSEQLRGLNEIGELAEQISEIEYMNALVAVAEAGEEMSEGELAEVMAEELASLPSTRKGKMARILRSKEIRTGKSIVFHY